MPEFILAPCVEGELWEIWDFIAQDNPSAATRVVEAAFDSGTGWLGNGWQAAQS